MTSVMTHRTDTCHLLMCCCWVVYVDYDECNDTLNDTCHLLMCCCWVVYVDYDECNDTQNRHLSLVDVLLLGGVRRL